ncbi:hypothetical protein BN1088_1430489 [Sphingobacterium sp. PM2-P1-29]|nr:hypothetical protein BN1088_1430489 [Sphingobacterium sp. PM2-P1-29]
MEARIFTETKRTELFRPGGIYELNCDKLHTDLLYFRIDWSDKSWKNKRVTITIQLTEVSTHSFVPVVGNPDIQVTENTLICQALYSDKIKFVPFILRKRNASVRTPANFTVFSAQEDTFNNDAVSLALKLIKS